MTKPLHRNVVKVRDTLLSLGVDTAVVQYEESARTALEAAAAIGTSVAQIVKSLVFTCDGEPVLVLTSGSNRVSTEKLSALLEGRVARADADTVRAATGFPIGGVPPVGHAEDMRVVIDEDLLGFDEVWAAAGTPHAVFPVSPRQLAEVTRGSVADVKEPPWES